MYSVQNNFFNVLPLHYSGKYFGLGGRLRPCVLLLPRQAVYLADNTPSYFHKSLVRVERFELPTHWSQTSCATRLRYTRKNLVPPPGIELGIDDYKSTVIPFNYRGENLVDRWRIELQPPPCKGGVLPLSLAAQNALTNLGGTYSVCIRLLTPHYTLHPLPDRDRSRIASGLSV